MAAIDTSFKSSIAALRVAPASSAATVKLPSTQMAPISPPESDASSVKGEDAVVKMTGEPVEDWEGNYK